MRVTFFLLHQVFLLSLQQTPNGSARRFVAGEVGIPDAAKIHLCPWRIALVKIYLSGKARWY